MPIRYWSSGYAAAFVPVTQSGVFGDPAQAARNKIGVKTIKNGVRHHFGSSETDERLELISG
jgi:hypothetical protein